MPISPMTGWSRAAACRHLFVSFSLLMFHADDTMLSIRRCCRRFAFLLITASAYDVLIFSTPPMPPIRRWIDFRFSR